ncbi:MAG TPA: sugar phosphate isomerase/epimerase family protein [Fimbriimonas sp.]
MSFVACSTSVRCHSTLDKALEEIAGAGFREIDLLAIDGWVHLNPSDLARDYDSSFRTFDAKLKASNLIIRALNTGVGPQLHDRSSAAAEVRSAEIAALIRFMSEYGIRIAAIQPRNADRSRPADAVFADCIRTVREQVALGEEEGVEFALELHSNSPFETMEQARALVEAFGDVPLVYDPSHFVMQGVDLRDTAWLMNHAKHVHLRDAAHGRLQTRVGEGGVDFDWMLRSLQDGGYRGGYSLEYLETDEFDALEEALRLEELVKRYVT